MELPRKKCIYTTIKDVKWFFLTLFEKIFWNRREKFESNATVTSDANWNLVDGFIGRGGAGASHLDTPLKPHIATIPKLRPLFFFQTVFQTYLRYRPPIWITRTLSSLGCVYSSRFYDDWDCQKTAFTRVWW